MIEIAKILKPQGIKGEVKAQPFSNVPEVFNALEECLVGKEKLHIERISYRQGFLYIKFKEINDRNMAETYRNKSLFIDKELLKKFIDEDDFLIDDLIGKVLYDDKGQLVGQIVDIVNYGASDIVVLEKDKRLVEVPYLKEVFVKKGDTLVVDSEKLLEVMV